VAVLVLVLVMVIGEDDREERMIGKRGKRKERGMWGKWV
jgi:hypothetical protein